MDKKHFYLHIDRFRIQMCFFFLPLFSILIVFHLTSFFWSKKFGFQSAGSARSSLSPARPPSGCLGRAAAAAGSRGSARPGSSCSRSSLMRSSKDGHGPLAKLAGLS